MADAAPPPAVSLVSRHRQQILEYSRKSLTYTIFSVKWLPGTRKFVGVGNYPRNTGCIFVYESDKGNIKDVAEYEKPNPIRCATFGHCPDDVRRVATGSFTGELQVWDLERGSEGPTYRVQAHEGIINAIDGALYNGPPELATGGKDGCVRVWDTRQADKPLVVLQPPNKDQARDCWAVAFGNSFNRNERMVACGYDNGDVKLVDMRTNKVLWEECTGNGICDLTFDRGDIEMNKLQVATLEGRVRVYDLRTHHPTLGFAHLEQRVHGGTVWQVKALPSNREVFATCGPGELGIHKYVYPKQRSVKDQDGVEKGVVGVIETLNKSTLSTQPINSLDWNRDREGLACLSCFDQTLRLVNVTKLDLVR